MLSLKESIILANTPKFLYEKGILACQSLPKIENSLIRLEEFIKTDYTPEQVEEAYREFFQLVISNRSIVLDNIDRIRSKNIHMLSGICDHLKSLVSNSNQVLIPKTSASITAPKKQGTPNANFEIRADI